MCDPADVAVFIRASLQRSRTSNIRLWWVHAKQTIKPREFFRDGQGVASLMPTTRFAICTLPILDVVGLDVLQACDGHTYERRYIAHVTGDQKDARVQMESIQCTVP